MSEYSSGPGQAAAVKTRQEAKVPRLYKVLLHNDDYTTMDFVVMVLVEIFNKPQDEAVRIMLNVHHEDIGVCGLYPKAVAETKVAAVHELAQGHGFPLHCSMEPE